MQEKTGEFTTCDLTYTHTNRQLYWDCYLASHTVLVPFYSTACAVLLCWCVGVLCVSMIATRELSNRHMNRIMNGVCSSDSSSTHRGLTGSSDI